MNTKIKTRRQIENEVTDFHYTSLIDIKNVKKAMLDMNWINTMQENLN